ncbi:YdeI/OmpD-associated family protein [Listeria fleischmannii]|uniref:YdeI/OmpD-associated family protein n=1 Tax=Listeria fleischmannii TaxID=1069827 RepID=UPI000254F78B|nr:YdeI/OmpD-associated family protein [Listeria fleischmannii]EIA19392.1 protein of hypothetical function duf1801 [Listeria fleischmannii subsp. coloradonensis]
MTEGKMNPKIDEYLSHVKQWYSESEKLRSILLDCGLTEELKWGKPCYTFDGKNIVIIQGFKAYLALLFFKGSLVQDPHHILVKTGENTIVGRQIRFTSLADVEKLQEIIPKYINDAIEVEKRGETVQKQAPKEIPIPPEFQEKLDEDATLKEAFFSLTPGRQRGYIRHFAEPKQSKTKIARIEKYIPKILSGKGLMDYK